MGDAPDRDRRELDPRGFDLSLLSLFAGWAMADAITDALAEDGFGDVRFADGVVFQHLVERPRSIGELAMRLEVTQQAASKSVTGLERRGYVKRVPDAADARVTLVELSERGEKVIEAGRRRRAALERRLSRRLGAERVDASRELLADVLDELGAAPGLQSRRARPPR